MTSHSLPHLDELENEAIYIIREVAAQFERPVILFSGGKDSTALLHLAIKAFRPRDLPFPLLHIDTGHNFPELLSFRDELVKATGSRLIIRKVEETIQKGKVQEERGLKASRNALQSVTLLDSLREFTIDAAIGGARRDEESVRAKERIFSHRDEFGQWQPKYQRPEIWQLFNGRLQATEHFRIFPLSNWTEIDVWAYINREEIPVPALYFSHERTVVERDHLLLAHSPYLPSIPNEVPKLLRVRFRTVGDMTCTGAIESRATTVSEIMDEVSQSHFTERYSRSDDRRSESSMENRKRAGYF